MSQKEISPSRRPGGEPAPPGELPINTDEQPAGPESGPLQSVDERRRQDAERLVPPPQPEDNDV